MEQEDRKKKLAAGKEKLAAFRKKRAKKKAEGNDGQIQTQDSAQNNSTNAVEDPSLGSVASVPDLNTMSFTVESDHYSLTSGDEWSAEESDYQTASYYQSKLAAASERIAQLEEVVEGKQMALDRMALELQMSDSSPLKNYEEVSSSGESFSFKKGSIPGLQNALIQRDKIIQQLTACIQETALTSKGEGKEGLDYIEETHQLSQQVVLLQQQLAQAGDTVNQQMAMCRMSVQALQESRGKILDLQGIVTEKNNYLQQLSHTLNCRASELAKAKHREAELECVVETLQQQASSGQSDNLMAAQSAATRVVTLEEELEKLETEYSKSQQAVAELKEQLNQSQTACHSLIAEKDEALQRIVGLEEEFDQLARVKDEALEKISHLEHHVHESSLLLHTDIDGRATEAAEKISELEKELKELNDNSRIRIDQLSQQNSELEQLLSEHTESSQAEVLDLKNRMNSKQGELLSLREQLCLNEESLCVSEERVTSLTEQLKELENENKTRQLETAATFDSLQEQLECLREENNRYKDQLVQVQEQVDAFKGSLFTVSVHSESDLVSGERLLCENIEGTDDLGAELEIISQIQLLRSSYLQIVTQYSKMLQEKEHAGAQSPSQITSDIAKQEDTLHRLTEEVYRLENEVERYISIVGEKNVEIEKLNSQLQSTVEEKQNLALQAEQKEHAIEQHTLDSDTLQRKMESRVHSLFTEITEFKEALKESESVNIDLQDKLDMAIKEADSLKLQLAASEELMKQLQSQVNSEAAQLALTEAELQSAVKCKESMVQLEELLGEKDRAEKQVQHQLLEKNNAVLQFQEQLLQKDSFVAQLQDQLHQKDSSLLELQEHVNMNMETVSQLQGQLGEKEKTLCEIQEQMEETHKTLFQLQLIIEEKNQRLLELEEEKDKAVSHLQEQIDAKTEQLEAVVSERETAREEERVIHAILENDNESLRQQLQDVHQLQQSVIAEKEQLIASYQQDILTAEENFKQKQIEIEKMLTEKFELQLDKKMEEIEYLVNDKTDLNCKLNLAKDESNQQMHDLQERLDLKHDEYCALLSEKEELEKQYMTSIEAQVQLKDNVLSKEQAYEILLAESEQLREQLQSCSAAYARDKQVLKLDLQQQNHKCDILVTDLESIQTELLSRESENSWDLQKTRKQLKEQVIELEAIKNQISQARDDAHSKEKTIENLHSEINRLQEQLASAVASGAEASLNNEQAVEILQAKVNDLMLELVATKEETGVLTSRLASQTDMFKVKEEKMAAEADLLRVKKEEMAAENKVLNQQLQEVRNEAKETVHVLQKENGDLLQEAKTATAFSQSWESEVMKLKEELQMSRSSLQIQESELVSLKEEGQQLKENVGSLTTLNVALVQEKESLVDKVRRLENSIEDIQRELDNRVETLQREINLLQEDKGCLQSEKLQLCDQHNALQSQLEMGASQIEQLEEALQNSVSSGLKLKRDRDELQQQQDAQQAHFSTQVDNMQQQLANKDNELQSLQAEIKDTKSQLCSEVQYLQEELAQAQSEVEQKESVLTSTTEGLATARSQLAQITEEKEMLKNNFDCCMEDMTQQASEHINTIQQLQGRLVEASRNVDSSQGELKEMYESQLSEFEDRIAALNSENQRLERLCENISGDKEKMKESYNNQIAELELAVQAAESESSRLKEHISKLSETHDRETADIRRSSEIQLLSLEENCHSLEKALAKQDSVMQDNCSKYEREKIEREKVHEQQLCDAFEQIRLGELDCSRVKRQLDEMKKDHQKEIQEIQKDMETQIFDLENKCVIATSELDRLRNTLWGMEKDHSGETQSLHNKIQELEAHAHSQDKHISDLHDKLIQSTKMSDDSVHSLKESYQSNFAHLEQVNQELKNDVGAYQCQLKTSQAAHRKELEDLKQEHMESMVVVQERCRQAEHYSQVLQSHMESAVPSVDHHDRVILTEEIERLQQELVATEANTAVLKKQLRESQASWHYKVSELTERIDMLTSEKQAYVSHIKTLTEDFENEKHLLQKLQNICQDLELRNKQLTADNISLQLQSAVKEENSRSAQEGDHVMCIFEEPQAHQKTSETRDEKHVVTFENATGFVAEEGFEPEPDSLDYLDLAVDSKSCDDYYVAEESEPNKSPKMRAKSVPSEMALIIDVQQTQLMSASHVAHGRFPFYTESLFDKEQLSDAGRFEPEEDGDLSIPDEDCISEMKPPTATDVFLDGFQPESLPVSSSVQIPAAAPNPSFLPHPMTIPSETQTVVRSRDAVHSSTQTEILLSDSSTASLAMLPVAEPTQTNDMPAKDQTDQPKQVTNQETEFTRRLKSVQEQLEEEWVTKMRFQEVELRHSFDQELKEFKHQTEHQCQQQIQHIKQETQASFVDAVRKMRKSLKREHAKEKRSAVKEVLPASSGKSDPSVMDNSDDENLGDIVKQLHEENQELAEVRDVLLEQIAISQTRGRHRTMQHELQSVVAGGSKLSPSHSFKMSADTDRSEGVAIIEPVMHQDQFVATQNQAMCDENFEGDGNVAAYKLQDISDSQSTPIAGSDDEDDRSDGSCVRERFLEELEEMSQQSGQDLPLEWELTSTTVSHASSGAVPGAFERDQTGSGSVWEVFDGRCLRHDCREVRHRYNYLSHWLSRLCKHPVSPSLVREESYVGQGGGEEKDSPKGIEDGEGEGDGWDASGMSNLDPVLLRHLLEGREETVEAILNHSAHSDPAEEEERKNSDISGQPRIQLLSAETQTICPELCGYEKFCQECVESQLLVDTLRAKCDELENSNCPLTQLLTDLERKFGIVQSEKEEESGKATDEAGVGTDLNQKNISNVQVRCTSLQETVNTLLEDKQATRLQLVSTQAALESKQEENVSYQETDRILKGQCASLYEEIGILQNNKTTLQEQICRHKEMEEELQERCSLLTEKLENMSDYQEMVQKNNKLQELCSDLGNQLTASQKNVSEMFLEKKTVLLEKQEIGERCRDLKESVERLQAVEKGYKDLEEKFKNSQNKSKLSRSRLTYWDIGRSVQERNAPFNYAETTQTEASSDPASVPQTGQTDLEDQLESLQERNTCLQDKNAVLEDTNKSLQSKIAAHQERYMLLQGQVSAHDSRNEALCVDLRNTRDSLRAAEKTNSSLLNKIRELESLKDSDQNLKAMNRSLNEQCDELTRENKSLCNELSHLRKTESSLKTDYKLLENKCHALQHELQEATISGCSLREQLDEHNMTLESVISEMREDRQEHGMSENVLAENNPDKGDQSFDSSGQAVVGGQKWKQRVLELEQLTTQKDDLIAELKEEMTLLSLHQAALDCPPALRETTSDLQQEVQDLREEVMEKESINQQLNVQLKSLKHSQVDLTKKVRDLGEEIMEKESTNQKLNDRLESLKHLQAGLKRKVKEDSDLEQEVSILHQALFEKEKVIQELKGTSKLLLQGQQEKWQSVKKHVSKGPLPKSDRQERTTPVEDEVESQVHVSDIEGKQINIASSRSIESIESIPISSDPDSDIIPGQDMDIVKEIGRLRKDIKKTKAVYANESALFQEALDREPVSQIGPRTSQSCSIAVELSEMTQNDIPNDPDQLRQIVVRLLEENKCLTTENLRLQLRIREQEALVTEMEGRFQSIVNPPEDWQSLFERQLLLLQKQRDELQHQICERDSGVALLSTRVGKEAIEEMTLHQQQEDLTVKIGELEHCHRLLQQRQAELAHCQAEKRHLEQILLLKDETERQLMRQKRLLEEELSTIEGKLQEREAALVEEKSHLMKELKEKELHIFHLQLAQLSNPQHQSSKKDPGHSRLQSFVNRGPQGASTPRISSKFQSSQAYFSQPPISQTQDVSLSAFQKLAGEGSEEEIAFEQSTADSLSVGHHLDPKSSSFPTFDSKETIVHQQTAVQLPRRRHSTGAAGSGRYSPITVPKDPGEMYKLHREAVDRLREKLRLQMEQEVEEFSEGQEAAVSDYWQRHNNKMP